jgi:hypothetical protein
MHDDRPAPVWLILCESVAFASLASMARKISGGQPVRLSELLSVLIYSSVGAGVTAWQLLPYLSGNPALLAVVSGLSGLGIATLLDLAGGVYSAGGFCLTWSGRR